MAGIIDNLAGSQTSDSGGPGSKAPQDNQGIEQASEPKDVEYPSDQGVGRVEQMQHADDSDVTEETSESTRTRDNSSQPEVGLPSDADRRSDEL